LGDTATDDLAERNWIKTSALQYSVLYGTEQLDGVEVGEGAIALADC
jgi:hypothetical protein